MPNAVLETPAVDFFSEEEESGKFPGTIVVSESRTGDRGAYWHLVIHNDENGRFEVNNISNASKANPKAYAKSNKKVILSAFDKAGFTVKGRGPADFVGYQGDFDVFIRENGEGYNATVLFIPVTASGMADPTYVAGLRAEWDARMNSRGGGQRESVAVAQTTATAYPDETLAEVAELLDGVHEDKVFSMATNHRDETIRRGLMDESIITAAIGARYLDKDDDGVYHQV